MGWPINILKNIKSTKNLIKSRQIMHQMDKAFDAGNGAVYYTRMVPGDIRSLSYFKNENELAKAIVNGRTSKVQYQIEKFPTKLTWDTPQIARDFITGIQSVNETTNTTNDIMSRIAKDAASLNSGNKVSLITDGDLSKDSYPLLQSIFTRHQLNGEGIISVVKDGNTYRMIKLNYFGKNPKSLKRIDNSINTLRNITGDQNIPGRYTIGPFHYVPATEYTKYRLGGTLKYQRGGKSLMKVIRNLSLKEVPNKVKSTSKSLLEQTYEWKPEAFSGIEHITPQHIGFGNTVYFEIPEINFTPHNVTLPIFPEPKVVIPKQSPNEARHNNLEKALEKFAGDKEATRNWIKSKKK